MHISLVDLKLQYQNIKKEILEITEKIFDQQNFVVESIKIFFDSLDKGK